jgi:Spy/CpxP family protein refolding chaperone
MRSLAKKIGITSEQASQLRELAKQNFKEGYPQMKARFKGMHQGRRAALEAFKSDTFEAGSLNIINITKMTDAFQRHPLLNWIEKAITLLTPEQRTKLADLLQQRAQRIVQ